VRSGTDPGAERPHQPAPPQPQRGDRQANQALHTIARVRHSHPRSHPATAAYFERRAREGRTDREIMRCLKRAIAREVYAKICQDLLDKA
jgi:hypothetical protein